MGANREYKSSVFTKLFNNTSNLLSLYNALSGNSLPPDTSVEIATLEDVLFTERRNDIAFVLADKIVVLIEHQSTINENMPLRLLIYAARVYEKLIDNDAIYYKKLLKIPKPEFIVLYNGADPFPDEKTLRLSDAYTGIPDMNGDLGGSLELEARVVNINEGRNGSILQKCAALTGYAAFIGKVRANRNAGMGIDLAVTKAVKDCMSNGILADFLKIHASEVINMISTEYNEEQARRVLAQESREEGLELGLEQGREQGLEQGLEQGREEGHRYQCRDYTRTDWEDADRPNR